MKEIETKYLRTYNDIVNGAFNNCWFAVQWGTTVAFFGKRRNSNRPGLFRLGINIPHLVSHIPGVLFAFELPGKNRKKTFNTRFGVVGIL